MTEYIISMSAETIAKNEDGATVRITPNMQEIVRCRDCKHFDTRKCKSHWPFRLDGFCAWGERK